jgi:predicted DNA-binding transcriptional regulator AlpA
MEEITHNNVPEALREISKDISEILRLHRQIYNTTKQPDFPDRTDIHGASEETGWSVATIYTKVNKRTIPFRKVKGSKTLIFSRLELREWLKNGRQETKQEMEERANDFLVKHK